MLQLFQLMVQTLFQGRNMAILVEVDLIFLMKYQLKNFNFRIEEEIFL